MLPEVGSTIVPPGWSSPEASAASIIRLAMRSFTDPPGLRYSTLASTSGASAPSVGQVEGPAEPDERGVADEVEERVHVLHRANLAVYPSVAVTAGCVASGRGGNRSSTQAGIGRGPGRRRALRARRRAVRRAGRRGEDRAAADRQRERRTSAGDGLVRPRPAGPGDPHRPARRLQRRRLRRGPRRGDARRPPRHGGRRAGGPPRAPAFVRRRRRAVERAGRAGRRRPRPPTPTSPSC